MKIPGARKGLAEAVTAVQGGLLGTVIVLTSDGVIIAWDHIAEELYGFSPSEAIGRSIFDLTVPAFAADELRDAIEAALSAGSSAFETTRTRKDGSTLSIDVAIRAVPATAGESMLIVNERDNAPFRHQREASSLESRYKDLLEAAPDAMVIVDAEGRIILVNSQTELLFGYAREELLGKPVEMLTPMGRRDVHPTHRRKYFGDPHPRPMGSGLSLSGRRKDGTEFPVEISLSPVTTSEGMLVTAAVRDISRRVVVEEALKTANQELEAFTYSVSHDLRAPIRQIDGFSRILGDHLGERLDEKGRHYLRRIRDGSQHMGRLVDDLLHLSRVGRQDVRPRHLALNAIVQEVVTDFHTETSGREIEWKVDPLPTVWYDPGLMKVVMTNLLSNAVKYTRGRSPARIQVGYETQNGRPVVLVRDNGVGFDMKYADKLFGVFQRLHRAEEFEGSGVGLATVHRIVRKHGGDIWVKAEPDHGATFFFTLGPASDLTPSR